NATRKIHEEKEKQQTKTKMLNGIYSAFKDMSHENIFKLQSSLAESATATIFHSFAELIIIVNMLIIVSLPVGFQKNLRGSGPVNGNPITE
ncbi:hypothetical protein L9F63_003482, partial [Diploptera punctata]